MQSILQQCVVLYNLNYICTDDAALLLRCHKQDDIRFVTDKFIDVAYMHRRVHQQFVVYSIDWLIIAFKTKDTTEWTQRQPLENAAAAGSAASIDLTQFTTAQKQTRWPSFFAR